MKFIATTFSLLGFSLLLQPLASAQSGNFFWDLAPTYYSKTKPTDAIAQMSDLLSTGKLKIEGASRLEKLDYILKTLAISPESQVLVFSKTSLQKNIISPSNPRALYFSENAYVGYVPGGAIEVIIQAPLLGPVFYLIENNKEGETKITRDTQRCVSCHANSRTENSPGMFIRSVFPDRNGQPLLSLGTSDITDTAAIAERWGGYYVTGQSSLAHLGNQTFTEDGQISPKPSFLPDLHQQIDTTKYPRATSDIIALLILEHQCHIHTLLNAASLQYRRSHYLAKLFDPDAALTKGTAGAVADSWAEKITEKIFFKDEADLRDGVEGNPNFQNAFISKFPKTAKGKSLADLRLYGHIFKHRCSYMVYSQAFQNLPTTIKDLVFKKMRQTLAGENPKIDWLKAPERRKISAILSETLPEWNK